MSGSAGGSSSGGSSSHKKPSSGGSHSTKKVGSAKHPSAPIIRKLSSKPAILGSLPPNPPLEFALNNPTTHTPQPIWPTWTLIKSQKESIVKSLFTDPDGFPLLPSTLRSSCSSWKRLGELYPPGITDKLTVTPSEGMQTMHRAIAGTGMHAQRSWNQVVAGQLNLILSKRKLFINQPEQNFLWSHIQPSSTKDGIVRYNPLGKYVLRVFHQGDWKMVVVDDYIPVDASGISLLPSCSNPMELWPLLLTKAILKVWPGYDFSLTGGVELLYTLCGWVSQSGVLSKSVLEYPYPKQHRPSSPVLPFNPLTDYSNTTTPTITTNNSGGTSQAATRPTSTTSNRAESASGRKSQQPQQPSTGKTKPMSAKKEAATAAAVKEELDDLQPVAPPGPLTTDQLHTYSSKRGELGWFNELVYAAPGSDSSSNSTNTTAASSSSSSSSSGLLFGYAWSATGSGIDGYPGLHTILNVPIERLTKFGAIQYEFDPLATPLALAQQQQANQQSTAANGPTPTTPSTTAAGKGRTNSSFGGGASIGSAGKNKKDTTVAPSASIATTPPPPPPAPASNENETAAPVGSRFHCLLLESFDMSNELAELADRDDSNASSSVANGVAAKGSKSSSSSSIGKVPPSTPGSVAKKPPTTPGGTSSTPKRESVSASGARDITSATPKSRRKEEEDRLRRIEEDAAALLALETAQLKAREDEIARSQRAQSRMEAWLRGEEHMLAEEELAKTTPQVKLTDLNTGVCVVARVDSFATQFEQLTLVRSLQAFSNLEKSFGNQNANGTSMSTNEKASTSSLDKSRSNGPSSSSSASSSSMFHTMDRVLDFCSGKDVRRPFSSLPPPSIFIPEEGPSSTTTTSSSSTSLIPAYLPTPQLEEADLEGMIAQGLPREAVQAREAHRRSEYQSAQLIEQSVHARRIFLHVEFQTNHPIGGGSSESEGPFNIPAIVKESSSSTLNTPMTPSTTLASSANGKSSKSQSGTKSSRPPSSVKGGASSKGGSSGGGVDVSGGGPNGSVGGPISYPLHQDPSPSPKSWSIQIERYDWSTNRREIVLERRMEVDEEGDSLHIQQEQRLACIEFILPPLEFQPTILKSSPSSNTNVDGSSIIGILDEIGTNTQTSTTTAASASPSASSSGVTSPTLKSKGSKKSLGTLDTLPLTTTTSPPVPGSVYRLIIQSCFGYALHVFSHSDFCLEEGKLGQTSALQAYANGDSNSSSSSSSSKSKDQGPSYTSNLIPVTSMFENVLPSTFVKSLEGTYPSQQSGGTQFVLFKYVLEVPVPIVLSDYVQEETIGSPSSSASKSVRNSKSGSVRKSSAGGGSASPSLTQRAIVTPTEDQPTPIVAPPSSSSTAAFSKLRLPTSAGDANLSLAAVWRHPSKGRNGAGVCQPINVVKKTTPTTKKADDQDDAKEDGSSSPSSSSSSVDSIWSPVDLDTPPHSTLISVQLSLQDVALLPFLRLEWLNNDTLDSYVVPVTGDTHTPTMSFLPNQRGYTLLCSAYVPHFQVFSSKYHIRLFSSRPLTSFNIETLGQQAMFIDEYRTNTSRILTRLLVSGTTQPNVTSSSSKEKNDSNASASSSSSLNGVVGLVPQALLQFQVHMPLGGLERVGLIAKVWDLDESLEHPIHSPPTPLTIVLAGGHTGPLVIPVLHVTKEQRVLIEVAFDPNHPSKEVLDHHTAMAGALVNGGASSTASASKDKDGLLSGPSTGITWSARFISSAAVSVALDKSIEDELLALKSSWSLGDGQRSKKARQVRDAFLESKNGQLFKVANGATQTSKAGGGGVGIAAKDGKGANAPAATNLNGATNGSTTSSSVPLPPIIVRSSLTNSVPSLSHQIVVNDAIESDRRTLQAQQLERSRLLRLSLDRQHHCILSLQHTQSESRDLGISEWRSEMDRIVHETWQQRQELRRTQIVQEVEIAELKNILNQTAETTSNIQLIHNFDEVNQSHTPFNDLPVGSTGSTNTATSTTGGIGGIGAVPPKDKPKSDNKKSKVDSSSLIESGRFGLGLYLESVEQSLLPISTYPKWKGGLIVQDAVRKLQEVCRETLIQPIQLARNYQIWKEQRARMTPTLPTTPAIGTRKANGTTTPTPSTAASNAVDKKGAPVSEPPGPPPFDRLSLANALWVGVSHTRRMASKMTFTHGLSSALLAAEVILLALSIEQLDKACEPLRLQAAAAANKETRTNDKSEEEKTADVDTPAVPPSSRSSSKQTKASKAAAAAALAASVPPPTDFHALEAWSTQVTQYGSLDQIVVEADHDSHPPLKLPFVNVTGGLPSNTSTRPASPFLPAIASRPGSANNTAITNLPTPSPPVDEPAEWIANPAAPSSTTGSEDLSSISSSPLNLPPASPTPLTTAVAIESISHAIACLGRDTLQTLLSSLPGDAGIRPHELLTPSGSHTPSVGSVVTAASGVGVCGSCFLRALLSRRAHLLSLADGALVTHRIEQERLRQAASEAAARKAAEEKEANENKNNGKVKPTSGSNKKKTTATPNTNKPTPTTKTK